MRLIDADALAKFPIRLNHYDRINGNEHYVFGIEAVLKYAENLPSIDAEPVRHAAWQYEISFEDESKRNDFDVTCTGCGALFGTETRDDAEIVIMGRWDYCPLCGAKMDLEVRHD